MFRRMGRRNLKEKGVRKMKTLSKLLLVLAVIGLLGVANVWADSSTQDVTLTVTPITVSLFSISPNTYAYGNLDLAISSNSASGSVCPIIQNDGDVGLSLEKTVWSITSAGTAWSLATSTGTINEFVLWAMTEGETGAEGDRPAIADFKTGASYELSHSSFSITAQQYNNLTKETGGTQATLTPNGETGDSAALWFRIDMPSSVSKSDQQSIVVRIRATTQ